MTGRPYFQFYPVDWLGDPKLRIVSVEARCLWIDVLCLMHEGNPYGTLTTSEGVPLGTTEISRVVYLPKNRINFLINELRSAGVFSEDNGVIYSRRMVRDEEKRNKNKENGARGGNPALIRSVNRHDIPAVKPSLGLSPTSITNKETSFGKSSEQRSPLPNNCGQSIPVSRELAAIVREQMTEPQRTYDGTRPVDPRYVSDKPFSREESGKKPIEPLEPETGSLATAPLGGALRSPVSSETSKEATEKASNPVAPPSQLTRSQYDAMILRRHGL